MYHDGISHVSRLGLPSYPEPANRFKRKRPSSPSFVPARPRQRANLATAASGTALASDQENSGFSAEPEWAAIGSLQTQYDRV